jgi:hypothetical protein
MSTINTLLIKRRLPDSLLGAGAPASLSGGELAFNEIDSTLYYGASAGILPIAGPGQFVSRTLAQDVSGSKTFKDTTIFDAGVTINSTLDVNDTIEANSYTVTGVEVIDSSRNAFFENIDANGNLTVQGNLNVLGATTVIETTTTTTSSFAITNNGSDTALTVTQVDGSNDVAEFKDGVDTALIVKGSGRVGVGTNDPNKEFTVVGEISSSNNITAGSGNLYLDQSKLEGVSNLGLEINDGTYVGTWFSETNLLATGSNSNVKIGGENISIQRNDLYPTASGASQATLITLDAVTTKTTGTLSAVGGVTFDSTLDVTGAVVINNTLSATGAVDFDSTLDVFGATTLQSTLGVTQNATFFANVSGQMGVSEIINFIIDGGTF